MTKKKMTDVEKSIFEESEKINTIKAKVKARVSKIDDFALVEEQLSTDNWKDKEFQFTNNTVRLGTLFSGIGAIEHAFQRLKIKHEIVFAVILMKNANKAILQTMRLMKIIGLPT